VGGQGYFLAALPPAERTGTHCAGGWVGPRAGLYKHRISPPPHWDSMPGPSVYHGGVEEYSAVVGYDAVSIGK